MDHQNTPVINVTLFTGVWIEITPTQPRTLGISVTLFTGVWIEIGTYRVKPGYSSSHSSRVCGLKFR